MNTTLNAKHVHTSTSSRQYLSKIKNQFVNNPSPSPLTSRQNVLSLKAPRSSSFLRSPKTTKRADSGLRALNNFRNCEARRTVMVSSMKPGKELFATSSKGQDLMRRYQGKRKLVDLASGDSVQRSSSARKECSPYVVKHNVKPRNTTNAKEFRNSIKLSIQTSYESAVFCESEKEVKMNDLDSDFSDRKTSLITGQEQNIELNSTESNKTASVKF